MLICLQKIVYNHESKQASKFQSDPVPPLSINRVLKIISNHETKAFDETKQVLE